MLPDAYYFILVIRNLLPDTVYLTFVTYYLFPCTLILILVFWWMLDDTCKQLFTLYILSDTCYLPFVNIIFHLICVIRYLLPETCHLIFLAVTQAYSNRYRRAIKLPLFTFLDKYRPFHLPGPDQKNSFTTCVSQEMELSKQDMELFIPLQSIW